MELARNNFSTSRAAQSVWVTRSPSENQSDSREVSRKSLGLKLLHSFDILFYLTLWCAALLLAPRNMLWACNLFISMVAFAFWMVARWQLGSAFMIGLEARELVTHGLYRYFRHPIYYFGQVASVAAMLALQQWWLFAILSFAPFWQYTRIRREEAVLEKEFGDSFRQHRAKTWI